MHQAVDLDGNTLYHVASGGPQALVGALSMGIRPEYLDGNAGKALTFAVQHHAETGQVPSTADLQSLFGSSVCVQTGLAANWTFGEVMKRAMFRHIADGQQAITKALEANDPHGAYAALQALTKSSGDVKPAFIKPTPLWSLGAKVRSGYELVESGAMGIPSPWPSLNAMTMGWWERQNNWFVARPGVGKTWLQIICADFAWDQRNKEDGNKYNVLVISPEMSKVQMAERFFTTRSAVGYGSVVGGTLGEFAKQKFFGDLDKLKDQTGLWILDQTDGLTPERMEDAIDAVDAHLVVIDSAYKIKWHPRAKDRFENMYIGVDIISTWSKRDWRDGRAISTIAASQMNRGGAQKGGAKQSSVALADNLSWEADNLFFVEQTEDMKADKRLRLLTGKCRRMASYKPSILMRWDMDVMDFTEVPEVAKAKPKFKDNGFVGDSPY